MVKPELSMITFLTGWFWGFPSDSRPSRVAAARWRQRPILVRIFNSCQFSISAKSQPIPGGLFLFFSDVFYSSSCRHYWPQLTLWNCETLVEWSVFKPWHLPCTTDYWSYNWTAGISSQDMWPHFTQIFQCRNHCNPVHALQPQNSLRY